MTGINLLLVALFICISLIAVSLCSKENRWKALLITSLLFYYLLIGNKLVIILLMVGITFFFSHQIHKNSVRLWIPLLLLLTPLLIYKSISDSSHFESYTLHTLNATYSRNWVYVFQIIGLSYFTFNSISYLMDVKRNYIQPEKNFFLVLLYLTYFPTVFAGPLHRANYLFQQFRKIEVTNDTISRGLRLILWALFKNMIIAQRLFILITQVQNTAIGGVYYLLIGLLFFLYLYCNFSSFVDFFQGVSVLFNIILKNNFKNRIYLASSRQAFWRGWHITLNEWFRDYFFFILSKHDKKRKYTNYILLITFLLIAVWHEFSLVLLIWGICNGLWIIIEKKILPQREVVSNYKKTVGVMYHLLISGILALLFISPNLTTLFQKVIVQPSVFPYLYTKENLSRILIIIVCFWMMDVYYSKAKDKRMDEYIGEKSSFIRWLIYFKLALLIVIFGISPGVENYYIQF